MATATAPQTTAMQPARPNALATLRDQLDKARERLAEVAPKYLNVERVTRLLLAACGRTPKILECTPESVLRFAMKCAETGLEPIGAGGAWPIPYGKELTFIPDYRGLVHCAKRAGCIIDCYAEVVYEADDFDYALGMEPYLTHKPARRDRGQLEAAYCIVVLPEGIKRFVVMDRLDVLAIRKRSKASGSGPWVTDESEMWKKTVVRRAMKPFAGLSSHLDSAIEADDAVDGVVEDRRPVEMPKAIGEQSANGNGNHDANGHAEPEHIDAPDIDSQAIENEANERGQRLMELLRDIPLARKTHEAQVAKEFGGKKWPELTADEQASELQRLEKQLPVEA